MAKMEKVERPTRKTEYEIRFASNAAKRGWIDLLATIRNPLVDTWEFLTRTPLEVTPSNYPLRGELGTATRDGVRHERWQHKPTQRGDARIWFYVQGRNVCVEQVHTHHPNATK